MRDIGLNGITHKFGCEVDSSFERQKAVIGLSKSGCSLPAGFAALVSLVETFLARLDAWASFACRVLLHGLRTAASTDHASPAENTATNRPPTSSAHAFVNLPVITQSPASSR